MKYAFRNGFVLDGTENMEPKAGLMVLTEEDKIVGIVPDAEPIPKDYMEVDMAGMYLMPGLINLHVHIPASGKPGSTKDPKKTVKLLTSTALLRMVVKKMCERYAETELLSGVTTLRAVGGVINADTVVRDRILSNKVLGPRILAANMAVSVPGGHMAGSLAYEAHSAEEAAAFVEKIAKDKPDLIKLMITGGVLDATEKGEPGVLKMPPEYVKAACEKAHELGLMVAAHVESPEGVRVALENGVDTIEHGAEPTDEIIRLFKEKKAALVTTISPALPYALFDREISGASEMEQYNGNIVFEGIINCAKKCLAEGIPVGLGTDTGCPYITHYDMWREVVYFHKYTGVTPAFALYSATLGNAKVVHIDDITGSIEVGKSADFLVTAKNPLEDLTTLRTPAMVMARGHMVASPEVKKDPKIDAELDKYL